jgi:hypothetical protein
MVARRWVAVVVLGALSSLAAQYRTKNFLVEAATPEMAKHIGDWAEYYRKQKALEWLGQEMPPWGQPCPLQVKVSYNGSGGATTFGFDQGSILSMKMEIEGTPERLTYSVLPHEVTHTVFANHFRCPVPRWADEGGSVLSEDEPERNRHDTLVRQVLNSGRSIRLRTLLSLTQYPRDVMVLYAEGYSVTSFLVGKSSRPEFLNFVADGMRQGWDQALQAHYRYRNVEELEQAWLQHLRENKRTGPATTLASTGGKAEAAAKPANRVVVRQTLPPAVPVLGAPRPVVRGVSAEDGEAKAGAPEGWATPFPAPPSETARSGVRLGAPRSVAPGGSWNNPSSPVGYSP